MVPTSVLHPDNDDDPSLSKPHPDMSLFPFVDSNEPDEHLKSLTFVENTLTMES